MTTFLVALAVQTRSGFQHVMGCFRLTPMHNSVGQMHIQHHRLHPLIAYVGYNMCSRIREDRCLAKLMKLLALYFPLFCSIDLFRHYWTCDARYLNSYLMLILLKF